MTAFQKNDMLGPELPVDMGQIQDQEVIQASKQLKWDKVCGLDAVPAEFWKAIIQTNTPACRWVVDFCNMCWMERMFQKLGTKRVLQPSLRRVMLHSARTTDPSLC